MPSGIGYGAGQGLEKVLARLFLEQQARQKADEDAKNRALEERRVAIGEKEAALQDEIAHRPAPKKPPISVGGRLIDPDTYQTVYEAPKDPEKPIVLSPGATVFDPTKGAATFTAPEPPKAPPQKRLFTINGSLVDEDGNVIRTVPKQGDGAPAKPEGPSAYTAEHAQRVLESVDALMSKVGAGTAGLGGSVMSMIPGTNATDFAAELDTLKGNIAFNELAQMREASKTGGALGQVSERELALLSSTLGALNARQSPENLRQQLQKVRDSIGRWQQAQQAQGSGAGVSLDAARAGMGAGAKPPTAKTPAASPADDLLKKYGF